MAAAIGYLQRPLAFLDGERVEGKRTIMWGHFRRFSALLNRSDPPSTEPPCQDDDLIRPPCADRRSSRKAIAGLPRPGTFKRQESERRERLVPNEIGPMERRTVSVDRRRSVSARRATSASLPDPSPPAPSPPLNHEPCPASAVTAPEPTQDEKDEALTTDQGERLDGNAGTNGDLPPPFSSVDGYSDAGMLSEGIDEDLLNDELEHRWILNLSMLFRDRSDREKFFVTFAEMPNRWRRVTVSCDYRDAPPDSLEQDLKGLRYQRDKNARIYESIRESLPDIQFYDTVTNLKLQTTDGRLHVHVTEDVNEIVPYPPISAIGHLACPRFKESSLQFDAHMSGYVYKVATEGQEFIKKEIPGPDSVDEFLYEINALNCLKDSKSVIRFGGVIVDDEERLVKGLLISFAERGALVDLLFDEKGNLPWQRRERWAQQIVQGLSEIHEEGFVQGDFTLSNIVIDSRDDAKIIDINRRGCPLGWEPPEVTALIESNQRISMYIGVKSDLFQLGMVLWALAQQQDEPEMQPRPLTLKSASSDVPQCYRDVVEVCLSDRPRERLAAKELLKYFPEIGEAVLPLPVEPREGGSSSSEKQYIDPNDAVEREDIARFRQLQSDGQANDAEAHVSSEGATYVNAAQSSDTGYGSSGTYVISRGRMGNNRRGSTDTSAPQQDPTTGDAIAACEEDQRTNNKIVIPNDNGVVPDNDGELSPQIVSVSPQSGRWEEVQVEGHHYLLDRHSLELKREDVDVPSVEEQQLSKVPCPVEN